MLQMFVTATEIAGGSPPDDIDIYVVPDMLQTEISVMELVGGWCLALTFHAGGQNYIRIPIPLPLSTGLLLSLVVTGIIV